MKETSESQGLRRAGGCLVAGALGWQPLLAVEYLKHLQNRSATVAWYANQIGFLVVMVLLTAGIVALGNARTAGNGRTGRWALRGLALAWGLLVAGQVLQLLHIGVGQALFPIGGLLTYPTLLVAAVVVARRGNLTGWRRWSLLLLAVYQVVGILVPLLVANWGPVWATEAVWQLGWLVVGVAAWRQASVSRAPLTSAARSSILSR